MHDAPLTFEQLDEIEAELRDPTSIVGLPFVIYGDHERWGAVVLIRHDRIERVGTLISEHPHGGFIEDEPASQSAD